MTKRPFDEIMDEWKFAHDAITEKWIEQGKPEMIMAWGEYIPFTDTHDRISRECQAELLENGYLDIDTDQPPDWGTPSFVNTHKAASIVSAVKDAKRQQAG